jgi:fructose-bisphosphate aldolase class 1
MNTQLMVASDMGLLAIDESNPTCNKRFAKWGISHLPKIQFPSRQT